jgi:predicted nucleic acid-binding OB-fold protein
MMSSSSSITQELFSSYSGPKELTNKNRREVTSVLEKICPKRDHDFGESWLACEDVNSRVRKLVAVALPGPIPKVSALVRFLTEVIKC